MLSLAESIRTSCTGSGSIERCLATALLNPRRRAKPVEPDHISHSQIDMYLGCAKRYEYKYVLHIPEQPSSNLIQGSCYHGAVEYNFSKKIEVGIDAPLDEVLDVYSDALDSSVRDAKNIAPGWLPAPYLKDEGIGLVRAYRITTAPGVIPLEVEKSIQTIVGGVKLITRIDLIDEDLKVYEHKTSARKYTQDKVDKMIQLSAEAFALGSPIECEVHVALKYRDPKIDRLVTRRNVDDILWWRELAVSVIKGVRAGVFPANPNNWICSPKYCGYFERCKKGTTAYFAVGGTEE